MPELPEVEIIKRGLQKTIVGKKIVGIKVLREKSFKGDPKEIIGKIVKSVDRRAKLLIIKLLPATYLVIHLKMTGQLVFRQETKNQKPKTNPSSTESRRGRENTNQKFKNKKSPHDIDELPNKYTRVIIEFRDGSRLFFNDLRVFGWLKVFPSYQLLTTSYQFGPEALGKDFTAVYLKEILSKWGRPVKLLLMDQRKIAGIGNIYANEALFCAKIAPHHRGRDLVKDHPEKVEKLYSYIKKVLQLGLKYGGSTSSDDAFRNVEGEKGKMQQHLLVYAKAGEDCPNKCGKKIRRMTLGGRGTFFCPRCQR